MRKDPMLEAALRRNRRWIINNQLKNIILRCPNGVATVRYIQKHFKTLDLQGKALNWLQKYPCCFDVFSNNEDGEILCRLTKRMMALVEEEEMVRDAHEPVMVETLARLLMMTANGRMNAVKFGELKQNFDFPDDYLLRIIPKYPEIFRVVNHIGRRSNLEIELVSWQPDMAISAVETFGTPPSFLGFLPENWGKSRDKFREFNALPYMCLLTPVVENWREGDGKEGGGCGSRVTLTDIVEEGVNHEIDSFPTRVHIAGEAPCILDESSGDLLCLQPLSDTYCSFKGGLFGIKIDLQGSACCCKGRIWGIDVGGIT